MFKFVTENGLILSDIFLITAAIMMADGGPSLVLFLAGRLLLLKTKFFALFQVFAYRGSPWILCYCRL